MKTAVLDPKDGSGAKNSRHIKTDLERSGSTRIAVLGHVEIRCYQ